MHILSKYKDYYDYLTGIYGEDPLIVLDRTKWNSLPYKPYSSSIFHLFIGGYLIEGYWNGEKFYWGENLKQFEDKRKYRSAYLGEHYSNPNVHKEDIILLDDKNLRYPTCLIRPVLDNQLINEKEGCPILMKWNYDGYLHYPILSEFNLASFIPAEQMYRMIYDWLSLQRTKAEDRPDNRTNIEKIQTNGFDKQISFRGK